MNETRRRIITTDWDLRTWEEIAKAAYMSVSTAKRRARDPDDPLPVQKYISCVRARRKDVDAWRMRHTGEAAS